MTGDSPAYSLNLLSLCAILQWFDDDLLRALAPHDASEIAALLASDQVVPAPDFAGAYRLRTDLKEQLLTRLRTEQPQDTLTLHKRAFRSFLQRMQQPDLAERHPYDEAACLYHLSKLFFLLLPNLEWQAIAEFVAAVRAAGPQQPRHHNQLAIYEGYLAVRTHDYQRGETILTTFLDQPGLDSDLRVHVLNALAQAYWFQTRYDRALALYQQLYDCAGEAGNRLYQGIALINMGQVYNNLEYYEQALDLTKQALQICREVGNAPREAYALYEIANNATQLGQWQVALEHLHQAIIHYEQLGLVGGLANAYWNQGFLNHMLGDEALSEAAYLRALVFAQSPEHGDPAVALDIYLQLGFLYDTQQHWDAALTVYNQAVELATSLKREHRLGVLHYRRANVFQQCGRLDDAYTAYEQAISGIETLRGDALDEMVKIGLIGTTQQFYEAIVLLCLTQERPITAFEYVERARSRAFLDSLARKSPELYDALDQPIVTLAEVQRTLQPGTLLIEYFTTGVVPRGEHLLSKLPPANARLREHLTVSPHLIIFAITSDHFEIHTAALNPNILQPQPGDPGPGLRLLRDRLLIQLHQQLIGPVQHLLCACDLLYLVPHGPLHYVPFMALHDADGAQLLTRDGPAIALAPSATVLLRNCLGRPANSAGELLAFGYNGAGDGALRYAEAEARHVAQLMGGTAWSGSAPKRQQLLATNVQTRWLHIAGHAIYNPRDPYSSQLHLGANDALTARDIMSELNLTVELVTLSACTSGLNQVVAGDELLGLQRAFLYAGAPAVVCTLWETADFVALLVMDRFYTALRQGRPTADALREAQVGLRGMTGRDLVATIARWRIEDPAFVAELDDLPDIPDEHLDTLLYIDPFYWAPFMLIGRPA